MSWVVTVSNFYKRMITKNKYAKAIKKGKEFEFLTGKDEYRYGAFDYREPDIHDVSLTTYDIVQYAEIFGEEQMLKQLSKDLKKTSQLAKTPWDISMVVAHISNIISCFFEGELQNQFKIDEELKRVIKKKVEEFAKQYGTEVEKFEPDFRINEKDHVYYYYNTLRRIASLNERYKINLLNIE
jgi:hypothetical protein